MIKTRQEYENERRMLEGNLNRMCVTDDMFELSEMMCFAIGRLNDIYLYHKRRLVYRDLEVKENEQDD